MSVYPTHHWPPPAPPHIVPDGWMPVFEAFRFVGSALYGDEWADGKELAAQDARTIDLLATRPGTELSRKQYDAYWVALKRRPPSFFPDKDSEVAAHDRAHKVWDQLCRWLDSERIQAKALLTSGIKLPLHHSVFAAADARMMLYSGKRKVRSEYGYVLVSTEDLEAVIREGCQSSIGANDKVEITPSMYSPPYLEFMTQASRDLGLGPDTKKPKYQIEDHLRENWPEALGEPSTRKIDLMATFMRQPEDQKGGHFKPDREDKG